MENKEQYIFWAIHSILEAGDIQYMNAGLGARHAEEDVFEKRRS